MAEEYAGQLTLPDKGINPLRIKPPEGQMMAVVKGNKDGELDHFIASISDWHFKNQERGNKSSVVDGWEIVPNAGSTYTPNPNMPEAEFSIVVVGFLKALHVPHLRYTKWELKPGDKSPSLISKERKDSPFFFFQYNMSIPVQEVESQGNFKTTINMNVVVRIVNPYKALFLAGGWESLLDAAVHGVVRDVLSGLEVEKIRAIKEGSKGELTGPIKELSEGDDGLRKKFGIEVIDVRFVSFEVKGDPKVEAALQAEEVNRLNAKAAFHKGEEIKTLANATAEAEKTMAAAARVSAEAYGSGEVAGAVRQYELLKEALLGTQATVISLGGNNPIAITPPAKKT